MNPILIATLAGVVTALCWGVGDWLTAKGSKKFDKFEISFTSQMPGALIMLPILLFSGLPIPSTTQLLTILLLGLLIICAYLLFVSALSSGSAGIVVPLANTYPLVTLTLSTIFIGRVFSGMQIIAMLVIVTGAILLAYEKNSKKVPVRVLYRESLLAISAACVWGLAFFIADSVIGDIPWQMLSGLMSIFMVSVSGLILIVIHKSKVRSVMKRAFNNKMILVAGSVFQIGNIAFWSGAEHSGSVIIPAVIASGAPLVASALAAVVDKESIGLIRRFGAVVVVAGIVTLNLI